MKYIISYDLGTGGTKASLFDEDGVSLASCFISHKTYFPAEGFHEQKPADWWDAIIKATARLLLENPQKKKAIAAIAVSGHSLGAIPVDGNGTLLAEYVPIWSDSRAKKQADKFFETIDKDTWYLTTGNGFPAPLYSIFKQMWYKDNMPDLYISTHKFIGTKDYINYKLTGKLYTDYSYASGSGMYDLKNWCYKDEYIAAAGVSKDKLPEILPSSKVIGTLTSDAAQLLGIDRKIKVVCGGVDNSCMALGAGCIRNGVSYISLGTSAWLSVSGDAPIVDAEKKPYVFAHCIPGMFVSATSVFSAGNSLRWLRDNICKNLLDEDNAYDAMMYLASKSPIGSKNLIFNPSLAGGSSQDKSTNIKGGFIGLKLEHTQEDLIRAVIEGICLNLRVALDVLAGYTKISEDMLLVGGGGKSQFWRKLFADILNKNIIESRICEDAGSFGAFALAAVGVGIWNSFDRISSAHEIKNRIAPNENNNKMYEEILVIFEKVSDALSDIGDFMENAKL